MSIEFTCPKCSQMLRVPDTAAGKQAKCPQCQTLVSIPADMAPQQPAQPNQPIPDTPAPNQFGDPKPSADGAYDNPYATSAMPDPTGFGAPTAVPGGPIQNVLVDAGEVFKHAFDCWKRDLGVLVAASFVAQAPQIPFNIASRIFTMNGDQNMAAMVDIASFFIATPLQIYLSLGVTVIMLASARRERVEFGMLFYKGPGTIVKMFSILGFYLLILISMFACFLGLVLALFYWPFSMILVDKNVGFGEAFSLGRECTRGNEGTTVLLFLMGIGVMILGFLALCVGLFFAQPLFGMMFTTGYLMMGGQLKSSRAY